MDTCTFLFTFKTLNMFQYKKNFLLEGMQLFWRELM